MSPYVALITLVLKIVDGVMGRMDEKSRNAVQANLRDAQWLQVGSDVKKKAADAFDHAGAGGVSTGDGHSDGRFRD